MTPKKFNLHITLLKNCYFEILIEMANFEKLKRTLKNDSKHIYNLTVRKKSVIVLISFERTRLQNTVSSA